MSGRARRLIPPLLLSSACALALAACGGRERAVALSADPSLMPRLEAMVADLPLPRGWSVTGPGEEGDARLSLAAYPVGDPPPGGSAPCGIQYLAAPADLSENLYSVDAARAAGLGLEPLEGIIPPRRALAVDDAWPSSPGYPFSMRLYLSAAAAGANRPLPRDLLRWATAAASAASEHDARPLLLTAAGDMQIGEAQGPLLLGGEEGLGTLLRGGILGRLRGADLSVANLESPISSRGEPNPAKRYRFRMPPGASAALRLAGFDLLLFGNNHAFDFGPEAFTDTLDDLARASLPMVGAGRDLAEASAARVLADGGGARLAFVGYAFFPDESRGFAIRDAAAGEALAGVSADEEAALASVRGAAASGATVVVLAHGGNEYVVRPGEAARRSYARFVDAGAALVIGTHPHVLQGCEAREGSLIAYSLGNFIFTLEDEPPEAWKGAMLDFLVYRGKVRGVMPRPIIAGYDHTEDDPDRSAAEARFARLCADIGAADSPSR